MHWSMTPSCCQKTCKKPASAFRELYKEWPLYELAQLYERGKSKVGDLLLQAEKNTHFN